MRVAVNWFELELRQPLKIGRGAITRREGVQIQIEEDFCHGWGEAMPLPDWPGDDLPTPRNDGQLSLPLTFGKGWRNTHWPSIEWSLNRWIRLRTQPPMDRFAGAAVGLARLDWRARKSGITQAEVLADGGPVADSVELNALIRNAEEAAAAVSSGYGTVKLKVGAHDIRDDVAAVAAVREAIGDSTRLRLDANGAWTVEQALDALTRLERYDIEYVEEPTPGLEALGHVAEHSPISVAVDESLEEPEATIPGAISAVVVKPMAFWGPINAYHYACRWIDQGLKVTITNYLDSAFGQHAALSVAAALPGPQQVHGVITPDLFTGDLTDLPHVTEGRCVLPPSAPVPSRVPK